MRTRNEAPRALARGFWSGILSGARIIRALKGAVLAPPKYNKQGKGQSMVEYAVLIGIVAAAFVAMSTYVQRAVQANIKMIENQTNARPASPLSP